jgi:hypothetical protein
MRPLTSVVNNYERIVDNLRDVLQEKYVTFTLYKQTHAVTSLIVFFSSSNRVLITVDKTKKTLYVDFTFDHDKLLDLVCASQHERAHNACYDHFVKLRVTRILKYCLDENADENFVIGPNYGTVEYA